MLNTSGVHHYLVLVNILPVADIDKIAGGCGLYFRVRIGLKMLITALTHPNCFEDLADNLQAMLMPVLKHNTTVKHQIKFGLAAMVELDQKMEVVLIIIIFHNEAY